MKRVSIRELQLYSTTLLRDLPFVITRYGKPIALVVSPDSRKFAIAEGGKIGSKKITPKS